MSLFSYYKRLILFICLIFINENLSFCDNEYMVYITVLWECLILIIQKLQKQEIELQFLSFAHIIVINQKSTLNQNHFW